MSDTPIVLMVCLGNICRSPTAEAAVRDAADRADVAVEVRSAGTGAWHVGSPPDARMTDAAATVGLTLGGQAEQVDAASMQAADLVLARDSSNLGALRAIAVEKGVATPVRLFREFDPEAHGELEVPDPYNGGPSGFDDVVAICCRTAEQLVTELGQLTADR